MDNFELDVRLLPDLNRLSRQSAVVAIYCNTSRLSRYLGNSGRGRKVGLVVNGLISDLTPRGKFGGMTQHRPHKWLMLFEIWPA